MPTGSLNFERTSHTATLLPDGSVLVTGGLAFFTLSSTEVYDPIAGSWSFTAGLTRARRDHTATHIGNGIVLVAGGQNDQGTTASAEIYIPAAGRTGFPPEV